MIEITKEDEYIELKKKFDEYYTDNLYPVLRDNENSRNRYLSIFFVLVLMALIFYPFLLYLIIKFYSQGMNSSGIGYILSLSGFVLMLLNGPIYFYKKKVKPQIMPEFARFFGNFEYFYEHKIPDSVLASSNLFKNFNENKGDDYFSGIYSDVGVTVAEEKLNMVRYDARRNKSAQKVFQGICILLEMNKNFKGRTVVLEDKGLFNVFNGVSGLQNVKLEDSKFEKYFEVYSDSQIESRYLLTTGFMERMLKLRDLYDGKSMQFNFSDNKLLIAISTKQDMFEANSFFRSNINKKRIDLVFEQFYTIFSIIKILKLNQKIGM